MSFGIFLGFVYLLVDVLGFVYLHVDVLGFVHLLVDVLGFVVFIYGTNLLVVLVELLAAVASSYRCIVVPGGCFPGRQDADFGSSGRFQQESS